MLKRILFIIALSLSVFSYGQGFVYSENIQNTFFGVKFGSSKEEVIKAFEKEGLYFVEEFSTRDELTFISSAILNGEIEAKVSFGGMFWNGVIANFSNGKFYKIDFQHNPEYKEMALKRLESVISTLSKRYKMKELSITTTDIYKWYSAESKDGKVVTVQCCKSERSGGEIMYYVNLEYLDLTLFNPNDDF